MKQTMLILYEKNIELRGNVTTNVYSCATIPMLTTNYYMQVHVWWEKGFTWQCWRTSLNVEGFL
jgi:hypothetical protein